jgi:hypothetical protein
MPWGDGIGPLACEKTEHIRTTRGVSRNPANPLPTLLDQAAKEDGV